MKDIDNKDLRKKMLQIYYDKYFGPKPRTLPMKLLSEKLDVDIKLIRANIDYLNSKKLIYQPDQIGLIPRIKGYYWITSEGIDLIEKNNKTDKKKTEALESIFQLKAKIFIGHGRSSDWRDLKDHLHEKQGYEVIAYEVGSRAGLSIKEVLEKMLTESSFALLVFTPEDEDKAGGFHARENVIHELGLFQAKLGFNRAIAVISDEVEEFSNIHGINQIRYSEGNIKETFGEILATIKREFPE